MKTPEDWAEGRWEHFAPDKPSFAVTLKEWIAAIQADAFAAGEHKGRIEGLREAAFLANHSTREGPIADHFNEIADRLEREQQTKL